MLRGDGIINALLIRNSFLTSTCQLTQAQCMNPALAQQHQFLSINSGDHHWVAALDGKGNPIFLQQEEKTVRLSLLNLLINHLIY